MEYPEYPLVVEELRRHFGKGYVTVPEIAEYDGICRRSVTAWYGIKGGCDIAVLAYAKCKHAHRKK